MSQETTIFGNEKNYEAAFRESESIIDATFHSIEDGILVISESGRVSHYNEKFREIWGLSADALQAEQDRQLVEFVLPKLVDKKEFVSRIREIYGSDEPSEDTLFFRDGRVVGRLSYPLVMRSGEKGRIWIFRDHTEKRQNEKALRLTQFSFDRSALGIFRINDDGDILTVNRQACRSLGYTKEELCRMTIFQIDPAMEPEKWRRHREKMWQEGNGTLESVHRRKDGSTFPVEVTVSYHQFHDEKFSISFSRDISERKARERELDQYRKHLEQMVSERTRELREAQEELFRQEHHALLGRLTGTVSHELRNPLGTISTSLYAIQHRTEGKNLGTERAIERCFRNIRRCVLVIEELLEFGRVDSFHAEPVFVDPWLEHVVKSMTIPAGVSLSLELEAGIALPLDPVFLERCVTHLLNNALQAMTDGNPTEKKHGVLSVQSRKSGNRLIIKISDTGTGIEPDLLERIFEPLYSTRGFGVGMGLPIARQAVEMHGGKLIAESVPGEGTCMIIQLPMLSAPAKH